MTVRDMAALRAAAVAKLAGRSPRAVGREKQLTALKWIYRWGWSSPGVVDAHASSGRRGLALGLVKKKLVDQHITEAVGGVRGVPDYVLTLTPDGVAEVESELKEDELIGYPSAEADKLIVWRQLRHDLLIQRYTAQRFSENKIMGFLTPREMRNQSAISVKQPDAVWMIAGKKIAIELELTAKKDRELDQFITNTILSIDPKDGRFNGCSILSQSAALIERYKKMFKDGNKIPKYKKDNTRRWVKIEKEYFIVPEFVKSSISFNTIKL